MRRAPYVIAYAIATALIIAGLIYGIRSSWGQGDNKSGASSTPTARPVRYMSSDGIIENIERRLTQHQGQQMKATCPKRVPTTVGTTFDCKVYFVGRTDVIAAAHVKIGVRGEFDWKSEPKVKSTPTPSPTPTS
ncbi:MAG: hypothetical protein JWQ70_1403 [Aeromicrobium sp.]|nr:hypothetical protein [Aeromicrobium sp.]